jgi:hypothetical protein
MAMWGVLLLGQVLVSRLYGACKALSLLLVVLVVVVWAQEQLLQLLLLVVVVVRGCWV